MIARPVKEQVPSSVDAYFKPAVTTSREREAMVDDPIIGRELPRINFLLDLQQQGMMIEGSSGPGTSPPRWEQQVAVGPEGYPRIWIHADLPGQ